MRLTLEVGRAADSTLKECMDATGKTAQSIIRKLLNTATAEELLQILSRSEGLHDSKEIKETY